MTVESALQADGGDRHRSLPLSFDQLLDKLERQVEQQIDGFVNQQTDIDKLALKEKVVSGFINRLDKVRMRSS